MAAAETKNWAVIYDVRFYVVANGSDDAKAQGERLLERWLRGDDDVEAEVVLGDVYSPDDED